MDDKHNILSESETEKEKEYKKELEEKQARLDAALNEAKKVGQYREIQAAVEAVDDVLNKLNVFDKIASEEELEQVMPDLLASLGRYSMSDRAYVFNWASSKHQILRMTHEWCAKGVFPTMERMQNLKISAIPNWAPRLKRGEAIVSTDWDAEKEKTPEEHAIFDGQSIHSLIIIPIFANQTLNGYIGFDNPEQSKAALSVRLLSSIGGHISSLKDNFCMMKELEEKQRILENSLDEINREKNILNALSVDYTTVYYCDLEKDTIMALKQGRDTNSAVTEENLIDGLQSYSFRIQYYYDTFVVHESAPDFVYKLSYEYLREYLSHNDRFAYRFRAHPNPAGQQHFEVQIVRLPHSSGFKIVMGYRYIDDIVAEQEKQKVQLENALAEATLNSEIINSISKLYWLIYRMNLVTGTYEEISAGNEVHRLTGKRGNTEEVFREVRETVVCEEHQEMMQEFLDTSTLSGRLQDTESVSTEYRAASGSWHLARFIVKKRAKSGQAINVLYVVRQIDKEKQAEIKYKDALQRANQSLQQQLDIITFALPGGVKISNDDENYSFKYVSEQFTQMLGYETPGELMSVSNGSMLGLVHPDDVGEGLADALEQYSSSDYYETTYRVKCRDGSWKYIEDRGHKVVSADGVIEHWNLILDKNELMEKTIALESEKKANQSKSDFLSRMSHDMRTPLNGIIGLLDICKKHPDDRKLVDSSRLKARVAADHLLSLINDTLELNKLENKDALLYEEAFHVPTIIREVETIAQMRADEEGIRISYENNIDKLKHPYLVGSPLYIKQVLLNLITNAIKYNKENGCVYCSLEEKELSEAEVTIKFTIRDTGIGMSQEFLKDIFKPFVQADTGPRSTYMGTGLGMAIVKNLVERMNGMIDIDSTMGVGTVIDVHLPFKIAEEHTEKEETEKQEVKQNRNIRVLLAEDNDLNREIASFVLKDEGMKVTEAVDGQQALSLFMEKPEHYFDAILMDIMMPLMDGYEATRLIRSSNKKDAKIIPIIAMTANTFDDDRKKAKAAGMNAHLPKPLDAQKLIETLEYFCTESDAG